MSIQQNKNSVIQSDRARRGKINTWVNQGVKRVGAQVKQAENRVRQYRKADARANKNIKAPMRSNNLAKLQDSLWNIGAFKGLKDKNGREVIYDTAVDGIKGNITEAAIANAKKMGYTVNSGNVIKPSKTTKPIQKKSVQEAGFSLPSLNIIKFFDDIIGNIGSEPPQDSKNTNLQAIFDHKKRFNIDKNYGVIDKKKSTLSIYNKDKLIASFPVTLGRNIGDGMMPLNVRWLSETPGTTGAGVFTLHGRGTSHYTGNEPMYTMRSDSIGSVAQALHSPANLTNRVEYFKTGKNNRVSLGCASTNCGIMEKIYNDKLLQTRDSMYVLPEIKGNNLIEKDSKLQMDWKGNNPKTYKDAHGITRNFRYNNNK